MCAVGDIIRIEEYMDHGNLLSRHSFVVIDDEPDKIEGVSYDMICNAMSSFKDPTQKERKMKYPGNFPIVIDDENMISANANSKDGYIKADQLYYFNKSKIRYRVIGNIKPDIFDLLLEFIEESDFELVDILDNL